MRAPSALSGYKLVRLASGVHSVHALAERETFHPVIGPVAEAEALYVRQLELPKRVCAQAGEFVIWDVGLGAAANPLTVLRAVRHLPGRLRLLSFDHTLAPLEFALANAAALGYLAGYEDSLRTLLQKHRATFRDGQMAVTWEFFPGDFPALLAQADAEAAPSGRSADTLKGGLQTATVLEGPPTPVLAAPHAILFDAFSPAKNPAMWTLSLFANLYRRLDPARPCALPTYSRSTLLRVTLLRAGFFVGVGHATGEKEETTIAANTLDLVAEPLDRRWLLRARRSTSAEPLDQPVYRQARLRPETWDRLLQHPQFC